MREDRETTVQDDGWKEERPDEERYRRAREAAVGGGQQGTAERRARAVRDARARVGQRRRESGSGFHHRSLGGVGCSPSDPHSAALLESAEGGRPQGGEP